MQGERALPPSNRTMFGLDFNSLPLALNLALFLIGGAIVWMAGTRLAIYADALAEQTGIGRAFLGMVLLAGVTELPECVTSLSAVYLGDAPLAVNNLFGGIVMQTAILAVADVASGRGAMSYFTPKPDLLLQGILLMTLLGLVLAGVVLGDQLVLGVAGIWTTTILGLYLLSLWLVARFEGGKHWRPVDLPDALAPEVARPERYSQEPPDPRRLWLILGAISVVILLAGSLLVATSEAIAHQSGLGSSFVGATLLATTTSLPELSTTLAAVRLRAYDMAFANIFGSNAIMVALLFVTDAVHGGGPILETVDPSAMFAAAMGIVVTGIYIVGLILRQPRTVLRMGVDSATVLGVYAVTLVGLYLLRNA